MVHPVTWFLVLYLHVLACVRGGVLVKNGLKYYLGTDAGFTTFPENLIPVDVSMIALRGNDIRELESMPQYPVLTSISFMDNLLWEFPNLVNASTSLASLSFRNNRMVKIRPERLAVLTKLWSLDLSLNFLTNIPDVPMPSLTTLKLGTNKIKSLSNITQLGMNLTLFWIEDNPLEVINHVIMPNLKNVALASNRLTAFPDIENMAANLEIFTLYQNSVRTVPKSKLAFLGKATLLSWSAIELVHFPDFSDSPTKDTLATLLLDYNEITHVPHDALMAMTALFVLSLKENPLVILPNLCHRPRPLVFGVTGPSMSCDCHLAWFKQMEGSGLTVIDPQSLELCTEPASLVGVKWSDITMDNLTCSDPVYQTASPHKISPGQYGCDVPGVVHWVPASSLLDCSGQCLTNRRCRYVKYSAPTPGTNNCGLSENGAPTVDLVMDTGPGDWWSMD